MATLGQGAGGGSGGVAEPPVSAEGGMLAPAGRAIAAAVMSYHPSTLPAMTRRSYRLELVSTLFFAIALACVEGGVVSVLTKNTFGGVVSVRWLNFAVAIVGASPEIANIISFVWTQVAHGRAKVPLVNVLQVCLVVMVGAMALMPRSPLGLWLMVGVILAARVCWSGIITIRPTIWKANYGREVRARIIGKLSSVQVLTIAGMGVLLGSLLDWDVRAIRVATPIAACFGLVAFFIYRKMRVRRHDRIVKSERGDVQNTVLPWMGPLIVVRVLRKDRDFAGFMLWMFVLGFSNIMMGPMLAITLAEQFGVGYLAGILVTSSIPAVGMFLTIPIWARVLGRAHVVRFRAVHSWVFVLASLSIALGAHIHSMPWMFVGAALQGVGLGGGTLAWNLGHVDFAPPTQASQYMATHVTLNGLRGLLGPFATVALYTWLKNVAIDTDERGLPILMGPGAAVVVFMVSAALAVAGALGFGFLYRAMGAKVKTVSRDS